MYEKQKEKRQVKKTKSAMRKMVCDTSLVFICRQLTFLTFSKLKIIIIYYSTQRILTSIAYICYVDAFCLEVEEIEVEEIGDLK